MPSARGSSLSGDLPYPVIKPMSLMSLALTDGFFIISITQEALE